MPESKTNSPLPASFAEADEHKQPLYRRFTGKALGPLAAGVAAVMALVDMDDLAGAARRDRGLD